MVQGWAAMVAAVMAAGAGPAPLQPVGKWTVEYADSACLLSRPFGTKAAEVTLALRPMPIGDSTEVVLLTTSSAKTVRTGMATVKIEPSGTPHKSNYVSWAAKDGVHYITTVTIKDAQVELAGATTVSFAVDRKPAVVLAPAGIGRAMAALAPCQADLLKSWKVDSTPPAVPATAIPGGRDWLDNDDYPEEALRNGNYGTSTILWTIGVDGRVSGCRVVGRSGSDMLDQAACAAITKRGRYVAAKDAQGKAVPSYQMRRIVWRIP